MHFDAMKWKLAARREVKELRAGNISPKELATAYVDRGGNAIGGAEKNKAWVRQLERNFQAGTQKTPADQVAAAKLLGHGNSEDRVNAIRKMQRHAYLNTDADVGSVEAARSLRHGQAETMMGRGRNPSFAGGRIAARELPENVRYHKRNPSSRKDGIRRHLSPENQQKNIANNAVRDTREVARKVDAFKQQVGAERAKLEALSPDANLQRSVARASAAGVPDTEILRTPADLDRFMAGPPSPRQAERLDDLRNIKRTADAVPTSIPPLRVPTPQTPSPQVLRAMGDGGKRGRNALIGAGVGLGALGLGAAGYGAYKALKGREKKASVPKAKGIIRRGIEIAKGSRRLPLASAAADELIRLNPGAVNGKVRVSPKAHKLLNEFRSEDRKTTALRLGGIGAGALASGGAMYAGVGHLQKKNREKEKKASELFDRLVTKAQVME